MTARDRWTVDLKCSHCGAEGEAELSQADGWEFARDQSTRIDSIPSGFVVASSPDDLSRPTFECAKCGPLK